MAPTALVAHSWAHSSLSLSMDCWAQTCMEKCTEPHEHHVKGCSFTSQWNLHHSSACGVGIAHQCQPSGFASVTEVQILALKQGMVLHSSSAPSVTALCKSAASTASLGLGTLEKSRDQGGRCPSCNPLFLKALIRKQPGLMSLAEVMGRKRLLPPSLGGRVLSGFLLSHTSAGWKVVGCFSWSWPFPVRNESQILCSSLTQFLGIVFPGYWQAQAWPVLPQSAWKGICRAPNRSTCAAALAAFLELGAINKICPLNWNFLYLLFSLGVVF